VWAVALVNNETIKEAQDYGIVNAQRNFKEFLVPWVSYEEKSVKLDDAAEHAYLYTPFLLMATDAREKTLNGKSISLLDSQRILTDYADSLTFSLVLFGNKENFAQNARVTLKQDQREIAAYQINMPAAAENVSKDGGQPLFKGQCYFYFQEKDMNLDAPVILSITTSDKKEHSFYFDMSKIK
jgi:hypothetical protein